MKWRLLSVSLSVSMAMPPMPEFSSSEVSVELNVSAAQREGGHYHIESLHSPHAPLQTNSTPLSHFNPCGICEDDTRMMQTRERFVNIDFLVCFVSTSAAVSWRQTRHGESRRSQSYRQTELCV